MPYYSFENKKSGKQFTKEMTNAEREQYLKNNPNVIQILTKLNMGDPVGLGIKKPPVEFQRDVIGRMKAAIPQNTIGRYSRFDTPKEV